MGKTNQQPPIAAPIVEALMRLEDARQRAMHAGENPWNHAVCVDVLSTAGLSQDHLTWMDQMGWIELGYEVGNPESPRRVFARSLRTAQSVRWCAVLTSAGLAALRNCQLGNCQLAYAHSLSNAPSNGQLNSSTNGRTNGHHTDVVGLSASRWNGHANAPRARRPKWDERTRELRLGKVLIKRLRCHAPNQILILNTFQEEGWSKAIDDPLPPHHEGDARRRLSDTIKALNRNQAAELIKFRSNGTGEVITWELVRTAREATSGKPRAANANGHLP